MSQRRKISIGLLWSDIFLGGGTLMRASWRAGGHRRSTEIIPPLPPLHPTGVITFGAFARSLDASPQQMSALRSEYLTRMSATEGPAGSDDHPADAGQCPSRIRSPDQHGEAGGGAEGGGGERAVAETNPEGA